MKFFTVLFALLAVVVLQAQPTNNAPTPPTRNASDVISIYGDAYTNITDVNYNPGWGQSGTVDIAFDPGTGDLVMAYTNFNYQGTGFEANPQNASAMEYIHIDIWTSNATDVKFSPIDNSGVGPGEVLVSVPLSAGQWSSVDLPKSAFTGMSWNSVFQLKFDGQGGATPSNIYLDNIYFWKEATAAGTDATLSALQVDGANVPGFAPSATSYTFGVPGGAAVPQITLATTTDANATVTAINQATAIPGDATVVVTAANGTTMATYTISFFYNSPATAAPTPTDQNVISLYSDAYTNVNVDFWNTSWSQAMYEEVMIEGNPTHKYTNLGFNGIETTSAPINASEMKYLHMDVWTPNITTLDIKLVSFLGDGFAGGNGDSEATVSVNPMPSQWNHVMIPLTDFTAAGLTDLTDLNQYILTSTPFGSGTLYMDNMYFSTDVVSVDDIQIANRVKLFPNPVAAGQRVFMTEEVVSVEVFNLQGQRIRVVQGDAVTALNLDKGVYIVKMKDAEGRLHTDRLVVQ
ncbi:MAG: T9SS type A sorting domain-containing protein [Saprospiraceae bacterium]